MRVREVSDAGRATGRTEDVGEGVAETGGDVGEDFAEFVGEGGKCLGVVERKAFVGDEDLGAVLGLGAGNVDSLTAAFLVGFGVFEGFEIALLCFLKLVNAFVQLFILIVIFG